MSRVRALFTRQTPSARRESVVETRLPAPPAPPPRVGIGSATRERCACGRVADTTPEVWLELRGMHLRAVCAGCYNRPDGGSP